MVSTPDKIVLQFKEDFDRAQLYWDAFWDHQVIDRPCTLVRAKKHKNTAMINRFVADDIAGKFEKTFLEFDRLYESYSYLGEAIPGFGPNFGPDQFASFLGAELETNPDNPAISWSRKVVEEWDDFLPLKIREDNIYFRQMKKFHAAAEKHYANRCLIYNIDTHSNIDALEALRGAQKLLFDMIDMPEVIREAMRQVRLLYQQVYLELEKYGDKKKLGSSSDMRLYSRGRTNYIQADFIALLSPDLFRKFVLPALEEESRFLDNSCFHLDGPDALKHLDDILSLDAIGVIQWVPGAGRKPAYEWQEVIKKIQNAKKSIIIYGNCEQIKQVHGRYKPEYLVYDVLAESEEEGLQLLEWLTKKT